MTIITQNKELINYDNVIYIYGEEYVDTNNKRVYSLLALLKTNISLPKIIGAFKTKEDLDAAKVKILNKIQDKVFI